MRDTAGDLGTLSHPSWPVELPLCGQTVDQQAALAGSGCTEPGRVKATYGTGVFVLAHVGDEVPEPAGGLLPTIAWRIDGSMEYALDGGVFAAGAMLEWMCAQLGVAENPAALGELARTADDAGSARVLPALAGIGAPWWRPNAQAVLSGLDGGTTRAMVARAALEGITWRVADVVAAIRETVDVAGLRVDGGLTNEPLVLQLQADAIGVPVAAAGADATVLGAAALAAVGSGVIASLADAAELMPVDRTVEPGRDDGWRDREHERWRAFVAATAALDNRLTGAVPPGRRSTTGEPGEAAHGLGLGPVEARGESQEELRGCQRVALGDVRAVHRQAERPRRIRERDRAFGGEPLGGQHVAEQGRRVQRELAETDARALQRRHQEAPLDPRRMGDENPAGQGFENDPEGIRERRCVHEVGWPQAVNANRLGIGHPLRADERRAGAGGDHPPLVDRNRGERDDLVAPGVESGRLQVDDRIARLPPRRLGRGRSSLQVGAGLRSSEAGVEAPAS